MTDEEPELCEWRDPGENGCVRPAGHDGNHVTGRGTETTLDFWEWEDGSARATLHADLKPGEVFTRQEAAGVYGYMEWLRTERDATDRPKREEH